MDKYIKQLLEEFSKIILPGFGAIVLEDEETGELMFNEYLTYNDGKLDTKIAEESNLEPQDVRNTIAKYVRDIQTQIDKGETYDIFGLGFFTKNKEGEVQFMGNLKTGHIKNTAFQGPSPTPQPTQDEKERSEGSPKTKVNQFTEPKEHKTADHNQQHSPMDIEGDKPKTKRKIDVSKTTKTSTTVSQNAIKTKEEKNKKRLSPFFWIIIIILIISAGAFTFIVSNYEKVETYMGWNEFEDVNGIQYTADKEQGLTANSSNQPDKDDETLSDETEFNTLGYEITGKNISEQALAKDGGTEKNKVEDNPSTNAVELEENKIDQKEKKTIKTGSYHLIAGSFSVYENAQQLVIDLKGKGLEAKIIGKIGALHFVSAQSYDSLEEAKNDLSRVRSKSSGAWIYKY